MFKKKKEVQVDVEPTVLSSDIKDEAASNLIKNGTPTMKDLMAPPMIDRSNARHLVVGNKFVRNFLMTGFPKMIGIGWAHQIYDYEGDLDVAIHVAPIESRLALDELTNKITQFQAQLTTELEKGSNRNITLLNQQISDLIEERAKLEQNYINSFGIQISMNLFADTEEQLNKESQLLETSVRGQKIKLMPSYLRQDQGYKTALPYGKSWMERNYRNFSSEGLTACFPFYNSSISHPSGVFMGVNTQTGTPIYIDFFDRKLLDSGNASVFGMTGSGKTFFTSLLLMRSTLEGIRTAIIDPEGEYKTITNALGGVNVEIKPGGAIPNPFDIQEEDELDDDGRPTGTQVVKIKDKVIDLVHLMGVMCKNLTPEQESLLSYTLEKTYADFEITPDPSSLYHNDAIINEEGELVHSGRRKVMPTISDFHERLIQFSKEAGNECLVPVSNTLRMFTKEGTFGMFDTHTPDSLHNIGDSLIVSFDVSALNDETLRPIGMYIALSWCSDKFSKQDLKIKKRIVCDEAWMMVKSSMPGSKYTGHFLENVARRIRKKNGSLFVVSQNFREFTESSQGLAVLTNCHTNVFLKQNATDLDAVQDHFKLSDGEREFLAAPSKGHFLLKMARESTTGYARPFPYEKYLIEKKSTAQMIANASN